MFCTAERINHMKVDLECLACVERQALVTLDYAGLSPETAELVMAEVREQLREPDWEQTPADLSNIAYRAVEKHLGKDPYKEAKHQQNSAALAYYPLLKSLVEKAEDRLRAAVRIAATGNVLDLGIGLKPDLEKEVADILDLELSVDDTPRLKEKLKDARRILYVGDNAGEIVFDRVLVEELLLSHEVVCAVRGGPVINDATLEDAEQVGLTKLTRVITTGTNRIGVPWNHTSHEFRRHFQQADLVICKGQGNFETLHGKSSVTDIFFILRAKCDLVGRLLGIRFLDLAIKHQAASVIPLL
jgi:damage-control phosphatase, subfamily I